MMTKLTLLSVMVATLLAGQKAHAQDAPVASLSPSIAQRPLVYPRGTATLSVGYVGAFAHRTWAGTTRSRHGIGFGVTYSVSDRVSLEVVGPFLVFDPLKFHGGELGGMVHLAGTTQQVGARVLVGREDFASAFGTRSATTFRISAPILLRIASVVRVDLEPGILSVSTEFSSGAAFVMPVQVGVSPIPAFHLAAGSDVTVALGDSTGVVVPLRLTAVATITTTTSMGSGVDAVRRESPGLDLYATINWPSLYTRSNLLSSDSSNIYELSLGAKIFFGR
jgi:hypothetical protein